MTLTRREFVAGMGLLVGGCSMKEINRLVDDVRQVARLGVIAHAEVGFDSTIKPLENVLRYFLQEGVDAVVIAGGATKRGHKGELEALQRIWHRIFAGTTVRLVTEEGRTEVNGFAFRVSHHAPSDKSDVLTFHGDGKHALTDELRFYDRVYRSVCAGSLNGVTIPAGYECGGKTSAEVTLPAQQGLLVGAYSSKVVIRRLDFTQARPLEGFKPAGIYAEDVAEEVVLNVDGSASRVREPAPEFWPDTTIKTHFGAVGDKRVLTVTWPPLLKRFVGVRAFGYEVGVHLVGPDGTRSQVPFLCKRVLSSKFMLAEERDTEPVSCQFDLAEAADGKAAVAVTPIGARGDLGKPVFSAPFQA